MYGKLVNGEVVYAPAEYEVVGPVVEGQSEETTIILDFNKSIYHMKQYGFKPVVDVKPHYIFETQYCEFLGYEDNGTYIITKYEVKEIEPTELELENIEMVSTLRMVADTITDDTMALQLQEYYNEWQVGVEVQSGKYLQYEGVLYKVLTTHTTQEDWTPDVSPSLFAKLLTDPTGEEVLEWVQPDSTNPYMTGDKVIHNGETYISTADNNVWEPGVYGWEIVAE